MKIKFFGWTLHNETELQYTEADRLASFLIMAYPDKVNRILFPYRITVHFTSTEYDIYLSSGRVPHRIVEIAAQYRFLLIKNMHLFLHEGNNFNRVIGSINRKPDINLTNKVRALTNGWHTTPSGIPYHALHDYVPVHLTDNQQYTETDDIIQVRQLVWNFKYSNHTVTPWMHVTAMCRVAEQLARHINQHFADVSDKLTLFCLPASSRDTSFLRYGEFSQYLCKMTGMQNSFPYVQFSADRIPAHLGGERINNYILDANYFSGRMIILFDDILTTGISVAQTKELLSQAGATVVAAYFIGRTVKTE